jgi:Zn-dependent peptidase ImmA (M78 family)
MAAFPDYYLGPFAPETPSPATALPLPQQRPRLPRSVYPTIAKRAQYESLRDLAAEYGVSHETIRAILRRASAIEGTMSAD